METTIQGLGPRAWGRKGPQRLLVEAEIQGGGLRERYGRFHKQGGLNIDPKTIQYMTPWRCVFVVISF